MPQISTSSSRAQVFQNDHDPLVSTPSFSSSWAHSKPFLTFLDCWVILQEQCCVKMMLHECSHQEPKTMLSIHPKCITDFLIGDSIYVGCI